MDNSGTYRPDPDSAGPGQSGAPRAPHQPTVSNLTKHLLSSQSSQTSLEQKAYLDHQKLQQEQHEIQQQIQKQQLQLQLEQHHNQQHHNQQQHHLFQHQYPQQHLQHVQQHQNQHQQHQGLASASYQSTYGYPPTLSSLSGSIGAPGGTGGGVAASSALYRDSSYTSHGHGPVLVPTASGYLPVAHNTPSMVTNSYSSNHSYTPAANFVPTQYLSLHQLAHNASSSYKPVGLGQGAATTTISMDSAVPFQLDLLLRDLFAQDQYQQQQQQQQHLEQFQHQQEYHADQPDHYMTYTEFLDTLIQKDTEAAIEALRDSGKPVQPEEHLNITDYPIDDLILMLSCLLSKIVEANDKLHPNHFDNTIAVRQKTKEEKRLRRAQKQKQHQQHQNGSEDLVDLTIEESSDEEEDEMKNKYLANVLAFHGKNIPGISLHAYLTRVLKYCPVTSDVFLSLLVYFDRIAKKANNLRKKKEANNESVVNGTADDSSEQLFVMDSYNIHRLIISGITVSSKFFSDIFYKNLRYAKVGGLPLEELNYLELQFLLLLDFKLMISVEDLQNYGDLLLRFWKREQVANELVLGSTLGVAQETEPPQDNQHQQQQSQQEPQVDHRGQSV